MTNPTPTDREPGLADLLRGVVDDSETLAGQQLRLLKTELRGELVLAGEAAAAMGLGAGLIAAGGAFSAVAMVHALNRATRLPLWGCYGLVGGLLGVAGVGLLATGRERAAGVRLPPPQSLAALRENIEWLKEQVS